MFYPCSSQPDTPRSLQADHGLVATCSPHHHSVRQPLHGDPYQKATASLIDIPRTAGAGSYIHMYIYTLYIYICIDIWYIYETYPWAGEKKEETGTSRIGWMEPLQEILICTEKTPWLPVIYIYIHTPWTVLNVIFVGKPPRGIQMFDWFWWWNLQFLGG